MMKRTYIDASVLIAAFQGYSHRASEILDDPERAFVVSDYLIATPPRLWHFPGLIQKMYAHQTPEPMLF